MGIRADQGVEPQSRALDKTWKRLVLQPARWSCGSKEDVQRPINCSALVFPWDSSTIRSSLVWVPSAGDNELIDVDSAITEFGGGRHKKFIEEGIDHAKTHRKLGKGT